MAESLFSIPAGLIPAARPPLPADFAPSDLAPSPVAPAHGLSRTLSVPLPVITAAWETAVGVPTGAPLLLARAPEVPLEYPDADGKMGWARVPVPLSFAAEPPDDAAILVLHEQGALLARVPRAMLVSAPSGLPPPRTERIGNPGASLVVPVFSERFADWEDFVGHVRGLHDWALTQAPFDRPEIGARLAFEAMFWPSDPATGLFHTGDDQNQGGRLFYGDRVLAKQLLDPFIGAARVSLILIDSALRGGAGGVPGYSAWTSIAAAAGERWEAVGLHEVGHALGLADEYVDALRANEWPAVFEGNVASDPRPSHAPWRHLVNQPDAPAPSFTEANESASPPGAIGTFQGARYREDLYRGARACLMHRTTESFCPICIAHIVATL